MMCARWSKASHFGAAGLAVRSQVLCFRMALAGVQEHEEVLHFAVIFMRQFVNCGLRIVNIDALRGHPFVAFRRKRCDQRELVRVYPLRLSIVFGW